MEDIVRNVRANEGLYRTREVIAEYLLTAEDSQLYDAPRRVKSIRGTHRIVLQGEYIYINIVESQGTQDGQESCRDTLQGYDGEKTRVVEQKAFCNLISGRQEDLRTYLLNPHTAPLRAPPLWVMFPLSAFLAAGDAIHSQPGYEQKNLGITYEGQEEIDGLRCARIRSFVWATDYKGPLDERVFQRIWLAEDRNYLPVRVEYHSNLTEGQPVEVHTAGDLREIEPGVWFPFRYASTIYDDNEVGKDGKLPVLSRDEVKIKEVNLHPEYDISLFRDIAFPPELPVYVIENGTIVETIRPVQIAAGGQGFARSRSFLLLVLGMSSLVGLVQVVRQITDTSTAN